jgi:lipoprotein-releasing system permease protein
MLKLFLWLKNLRRKKIVLLSIAAVALSCALLIVVASIFTGFIRAVENSGGDILGDIVIKAPRWVKFTEYESLLSELNKIDNVKASTAVLKSEGLVRVSEGNVRAVSIWGIDPAGRASVMDFKSSLLVQKGAPGTPQFSVSIDPNASGMFLGIGVILEPDARTDEYDMKAARDTVGQNVIVTTGTTAEKGDASQKQFRAVAIPFKVADVVFTGVYDMDAHFVYVPLEVLQKRLYPSSGPVADMIQVKLKNPDLGPQTLGRVYSVFAKFAKEDMGFNDYLIAETEIATAKEIQKFYIAELRKQMALLLVIFGAASLGAILLIFCIFYMIVITKQKDIAVLKSCGTSNSSVALLFISYGIFIGIAGSIVGTIIGYYFTKYINPIEYGISTLFGLKIWKSSVYVFSKIPNQMDVNSAVWIAIAAIIAAAIGALIPAVAASRMRPVKLLRYE